MPFGVRACNLPRRRRRHRRGNPRSLRGRATIAVNRWYGLGIHQDAAAGRFPSEKEVGGHGPVVRAPFPEIKTVDRPQCAAGDQLMGKAMPTGSDASGQRREGCRCYPQPRSSGPPRRRSWPSASLRGPTCQPAAARCRRARAACAEGQRWRRRTRRQTSSNRGRNARLRIAKTAVPALPGLYRQARSLDSRAHGQMPANLKLGHGSAAKNCNADPRRFIHDAWTQTLG